jgi:hypothetical protein
LLSFFIAFKSNGAISNLRFLNLFLSNKNSTLSLSYFCFSNYNYYCYLDSYKFNTFNLLSVFITL